MSFLLYVLILLFFFILTYFFLRRDATSVASKTNSDLIMSKTPLNEARNTSNIIKTQSSEKFYCQSHKIDLSFSDMDPLKPEVLVLKNRVYEKIWLSLFMLIIVFYSSIYSFPYFYAYSEGLLNLRALVSTLGHLFGFKIGFWSWLNYYLCYKRKSAEWILILMICTLGNEFIIIAKHGWDYLGDGTWLAFLLRGISTVLKTLFLIASFFLYKRYKNSH